MMFPFIEYMQFGSTYPLFWGVHIYFHFDKRMGHDGTTLEGTIIYIVLYGLLYLNTWCVVWEAEQYYHLTIRD